MSDGKDMSVVSEADEAAEADEADEQDDPLKRIHERGESFSTYNGESDEKPPSIRRNSMGLNDGEVPDSDEVNRTSNEL